MKILPKFYSLRKRSISVLRAYWYRLLKFFTTYAPGWGHHTFFDQPMGGGAGHINIAEVLSDILKYFQIFMIRAQIMQRPRAFYLTLLPPYIKALDACSGLQCLCLLALMPSKIQNSNLSPGLFMTPIPKKMVLFYRKW